MEKKRTTNVTIVVFSEQKIWHNIFFSSKLAEKARQNSLFFPSTTLPDVEPRQTQKGRGQKTDSVAEFDNGQIAGLTTTALPGELW